MKNILTIQLRWVLLFAVSMAFFESAVVVYLREIYYPDGFSFPLRSIDADIALTEILREAFSMLMIVSVAVLAGKSALQRFGYFLVIFAVWDIFYYVFLKLLLGWPESLLTQDVLFLIPLTWTGPVITPVINSLTMLVLGLALARAVTINGNAVVCRYSWLLLVTGSLLVLTAYMQEYTSYMTTEFSLSQILLHPKDPGVMQRASGFVPENFPWWLYLTGVALHLTAVFMVIRRNLFKGEKAVS